MVRCRVRVTLIGAVLVCGLLARPGVRGEEPNEADKIPALIQQLSNGQFAKREAAMRELANLDTALPALKQATTSADPEIRRRAEELVQRIEKRLETARLLQPKLVSLRYQNMPLVKAVEEFSRETHYPIQLVGIRPNPSRTVTLETDGLPFWEAFQLFCQEAGLVENTLVPSRSGKGDPKAAEQQRVEIALQLLQQQQQRRRVVVVDGHVYDQQVQPCLLVEGKPPALPTCQTGPIRIRALPPNLTPSGYSRSQDEVQLTLEVTPDPRLVWGHFGNIRIEKAVDDRGQVLTQCLRVPKTTADLNEVEEVLFLNEVMGETDPFGNGSRQLPLRLFLEKKRAVMLKELTGTISAQVRTPAEPLIVVDQVLKAEGKTLLGPEGSSLKIVKASRNQDGDVELQLEVQEPSAAANNAMFLGRGGRLGRVNRRLMVDSTGRSAPTNLTLLDTNGKPLSASRSQSGLLRKENEVVQQHQLTYPVRSGQGEPAKLVFTGQRTVAIQVPFKLENVPIP
jgi:hypothetical protein